MTLLNNTTNPRGSKNPSNTALSALTEVKIRAKRLLKANQRQDSNVVQRLATITAKLAISQTKIQLKHCLQVIALELGFNDFNHCQRVLSGQAQKGEDLGQLFHSQRCDSMLNHWFSQYQEARDFCQGTENNLLLPFKKQFFVVNRQNYFTILKLDVSSGLPTKEAPSWDLVDNYASTDWDNLAFMMIQHKLDGF